MTKQAQKTTFYPRFLYFTLTMDDYWRVVMVSGDDITAHSIILEHEDAIAVEKWLSSGQLGTYELGDEYIDVVLAPTIQSPIYWQVITEPMKHWKRRIGTPRSGHSPNPDIGVPFQGKI